MSLPPPTQRPVVVITGASAGIGAATARVLAQKGFNLVLGARRLDRLEELASELEASNCQVKIMTLDVTSQPSVAAFVEKVLANSTPYALINNAGLAKGVAPLAEGDLKDWQDTLDTNVMGVLRMTRAFLPAMLASGDNHHIVMLNSIAGEMVYEGGSVYCASKHALRAITKTLRLELNGKPIRITSIDPGMVETEFSFVRLQDEQKAKHVYNGLKPLSPEDVAECILFALQRPAHVNIDEIMLMPLAQAAPYKVTRS